MPYGAGGAVEIFPPPTTSNIRSRIITATRPLTAHDREFFGLNEPEAEEAPSSSFIVGLDLGQRQDYTALAVIEKLPGLQTRFHVRHLERFALGTSYPSVVYRVEQLLLGPQLAGRAALVVDATGVGRAVVDMLRQAGLSLAAVTITGGETVSHPATDEWHVPKRDLVSVLQVLLQSSRLKVAKLPEALILQREMGNFRVKITQSANDQYGAWRDGEHDDLVLAVALGCWWGEKDVSPQIRFL